MNDKLKGIIVCTVALGALGAAFGVLKLTGMDKPAGENDSSSSASAKAEEPDESVKLIDVETQDVRKVTATNEFGGFTFSAASESGKQGAHIEELDGLEQNASKLSDIPEDISQLTAKKLVEATASDMAKYGLEEPTASFCVEFSDGTTRTFDIGDTAPQNRYRYLREEGSSDVYMVLGVTLSSYTSRKEELLNMTLLPVPQSDDDSAQFGKLTVSRKDLDYDMVFENDNGQFEKSNENMPSAQVMTEPIFSYLNATTSSDIIYAIYGLTAQTAEVIFPTEEDLKDYELDDPAAAVNFSGEGYDYTLKIGKEYHEENLDGDLKTDASAYYCTFEGVDGKDCIWRIDSSALPWVHMLPTDVITTLMTWNMITDVSEVEIAGEENALFKLNVSGDDVESVTVDSEECSADEFKALYQYLLSCPTSEIWFDDPEGEPYLTIDIRRADGKAGDTLEFFTDTERRTIVKLNGRTSYRIQTKWVQRLESNAEAVRNGEKVVDEY